MTAKRRKSPKLTAKRRKRLSKSTFGLPSQRKYPVDTPGRAANAKSRARQQLNRGNLSRGQYTTIVSKANKKLGKGKRRRKKR